MDILKNKKADREFVRKIEGKGLSTEDYSTAEKNKLADVAPGANNYTHPVTHPLSMITETDELKVMTAAERAKLKLTGTYDFIANENLDEMTVVCLGENGGVDPVRVRDSKFGAFAQICTMNYGVFAIDTDPHNSERFVIVYADASNSNYGTAVVATISDDVITLGAPAVFKNGNVTQVAVSFSLFNENEFLIAYTDSGDSSQGAVKPGTISEEVISFGEQSVFNAGATNGISMFNYGSAYIIAFTDASNSNHGTVVACTVAEGVVTCGEKTVFKAASCSNVGITYNTSSGTIAIWYRTSNQGRMLTAWYEDSFVFMPEVTFSTTNINGPRLAFDPTSETRFVIVYGDVYNSNYVTAIVGESIEGTLTFGPKTVINERSLNDCSIGFYGSLLTINLASLTDPLKASIAVGEILDGVVNIFAQTNYGNDASAFKLYLTSENKLLVAYMDSSTDGYCAVALCEPAIYNLSSNTLLGVAPVSAAGDPVNVSLFGGIVVGFTDLVVGSNYYCNKHGLLNTYADGILVGRAISSTAILTKYVVQ